MFESRLFAQELNSGLRMRKGRKRTIGVPAPAITVACVRAGKNLPNSGNNFPHCRGSEWNWGPRPEKRGDRGRRRTVMRIDPGGGDDGEPVQSPPGQHEILLAVWLTSVGRNICGRAG
jgi:hypothetical protein